MKAVVQHNFTSGFGDFISDLSHYLSLLDNLKKEGYEINLIISLHDNKYVKDYFFNQIFDKETCDFFNTIKEIKIPITSLEYDGCKYYSSNHNPQTPGVHHFDIFFDTIPSNFKWHVFDAQRATNNVFPKILPKFNSVVIQKTNDFVSKLPKDYSFLHIRTSDVLDKNNLRYDKIVKNILNYIENTNTSFHLGTNNKYIFNSLKNQKNIYTYNFENFEIVDNDMNAFRFREQKKEHTNEMLLNRLINITSELISVEHASKIYYIHDIYWISNFLFYPICKRKNTIQLINKKEWSN